MFIDSVPKVSWEKVIQVPYQNPEQYDNDLAQLVGRHRRALIVNPQISKHSLIYHIESFPEEDGQCWVYYYRNEWIAKIFPRGWRPSQGFREIHLDIPKLVWRKNPDIDQSMTFEQSPFGHWEPDPWDVDYVMTWYMDPQFNPTEDKIWVMTCEVLGKKNRGTKDMGYLTPMVEIIYNQSFSHLEIDLDGQFPPYWELIYDNAYYIDRNHCGAKEGLVWVVKVSPAYRTAKEWRWFAEINIEPTVVYNPELGVIDYDIDLGLTHWSDFEFENVYYLDPRHLAKDHEDLWAFKVIWHREHQGIKVMGKVSPKVTTMINPDLDIELNVKEYIFVNDEFDTVVTAYLPLELTGNHKIWAWKQYVRHGEKDLDLGFVNLNTDTEFDVFFISYDEPNAEENYQRVKSLCPRVKRVQGVQGILAAHKAAAKKSKTSMFWVVDGDAWLVDHWKFDYVPTIFDRNCVFVWHSQNPFGDLNYGYGGVKLFPTRAVLDTKQWTTDLTMTVGKLLKVIPEVSNETRFNTSEFITWRSIFREVTKLLKNPTDQNKKRIAQWKKIKQGQHYLAARKAIEDATALIASNIDVNDYQLLQQIFKDRNRV